MKRVIAIVTMCILSSMAYAQLPKYSSGDTCGGCKSRSETTSPSPVFNSSSRATTSWQTGGYSGAILDSSRTETNRHSGQGLGVFSYPSSGKTIPKMFEKGTPILPGTGQYDQHNHQWQTHTPSSLFSHEAIMKSHKEPVSMGSPHKANPSIQHPREHQQDFGQAGRK